MAVTLLVCALVALAFQPWKRKIWRYWAISIVFALGGSIATVHTIQLASSTNNLATVRGEVIRSDGDKNKVLNANFATAPRCVIPTGVQIQGFKFETSLDLEIHGFIWQTYPSNCPKEFRGFVVPEAADNGFERHEIRRIQNADGSERVLYQFHTTQRQLFYYEHYPFDYQTLWLRLLSLDFDGGVVLVPDFDSYPKWEDGLKLGIDPDAEIGGFVLDFTRWSVFFPPTTTTFGLKPYDSPPNRLELYYNVGFHRLLVGPMVNHIVPVLVIIFLTFSALMFVHTDQDRATAVLSFLGALLFAAIFNHQGIIVSVSATGFTVIGLYCIVNYVLLIIVSLNTLLVAKTDIGWFERHDNLFSKAMFLPLTAWAIAIITYYALLIK